MKNILSRTSILGALLLLPGCATLAQDPRPVRPVTLSAEELDNLVAPIALHADALLAQILVAATFPEQVDAAAQYVRERGTRGIDDQNWDLSVKAVAHYPPVLNMLANDDDWALALGQAYASQSGDVMDAVQRLREMARQQGNLVTTPEQNVTVERERIVIVPANPEVIYVPTYDPYYVYSYPAFHLGFHGGHFAFGIGFPIGPWLVYDVDWWGRRVYYDGWYGGGWRFHARRYFGVIPPVYVHSRYRYVNYGHDIYSRRVNYGYLNKRHRYVRHDVDYVRHDWGRNGSGGGYRDGDRRGPYVGPRGSDRDGNDGDDRRGPGTNGPGYDGPRNGNGGNPGGRGDDRNDRIGNRVASFDDFRPDKGGNQPDARTAEPIITRPGSVKTKQREATQAQPPRSRSDAGSNGPTVFRGGVRNPPSFAAPPKATAGKASAYNNGRVQAPVIRGNGRVTTPESRGTAGGRTQSSDIRGARSSVPVFTSQPRPVTSGKAAGGFAGRSVQPSVRMSPNVPSSAGAARSAGSPRGGATMRSSGGSAGVRSSGGAVRSSGGGVRPSGGGVRSGGMRGGRSRD